MAKLTPFETDQILNEIRQSLPGPVQEERQLDGSYVLIGGEPSEVVVRLTANELSVAEYRVEWKTPYTPVVCPNVLGTLMWNRLPAVSTMLVLGSLIEAASDLRRVKYGKCEKCGEKKPPEQMHSERSCQSWAQRHEGVVY